MHVHVHVHVRSFLFEDLAPAGIAGQSCFMCPDTRDTRNTRQHFAA
jgi:hypothetical protein